MDILVVLPTYNEAENLIPICQALLELELDLGVLVVDDNSPDGTGQIADQLAANDPRVAVLHRPGKQGLGKAYVAGFKHALEHFPASRLVQMDADFSHHPRYLPSLVDATASGAVGIGSRYVAGGGVRNWGLGRRLLSRFGSLYARTILRLSINDVTGGFKCWPRPVLQALPLDRVRSDGYGFQAEMSYLTHRGGHELREVPIIFEDRRVGQSKMTLGIALEAMWMVWRIRFGN